MISTNGNSPAGETGQVDLIAYRDPRSPVAEAYRTLRTNIQFSSLDQKINTIMVTSTNQHEGKSILLANLAVTFAESGARIILVDADLRRPKQDKIFGVSNTTGLTTVVLGEVQQESSPHLPLQQTQVDGLRILTSGPLPPNPSELLGSMAMDRVIQALRAEADYILFDAPPAIAVTDAAVLARKVDGVLLVVSAGTTKRDHAARAKQKLEKVNAKILGVVLNNAGLDADSLNYYNE